SGIDSSDSSGGGQCPDGGRHSVFARRFTRQHGLAPVEVELGPLRACAFQRRCSVDADFPLDFCAVEPPGSKKWQGGQWKPVKPFARTASHVSTLNRRRVKAKLAPSGGPWPS